MNIKGYDEWKLATPWDDNCEVGTEEGQLCNRVAEPDEDAPRGYRPKPCKGEMMTRQEGAEYYETSWLECDTCGETT